MTESDVPATRLAGQDTLHIAARLERLPFSKFHRNFLLMVGSGEFAELTMLLGNGLVLALVATTLHFPPVVATYAIPVSFFFGEFLGSVLSGYIADKLGRRTVFMYDLLIFSAGMIAAGFSSTDYLMAIFVFVGGLGVGGEFAIVDTYSSEVFPGRERGRRMATVNTLSVIAAPLFAVLVFIVTRLSPAPYAFRILFWIMGALGLAVWAYRFRLPESPRWYEIKGRSDEAEQVMAGIEQQIMDQRQLSSLPPVQDSVQASKRPARYRDIFAPDLRGRTIMMIVFNFFQSGIFYGFTALAPTLLLHKGISLAHTLLFSMIIYTGYLVGSIISIFLADKIERKYGLMGSAIIAGVFGTIFATVANVAITVAFGFLVAMALFFFASLVHIYQAEIFPTRVRSTATGTSYGVSRISTSILILLITYVLLPHGVLAVFGGIWLFIIILVVDVGLFGPKTSRLAVEHISQ